MACCKACCGCADCAEGDQGKCCCGGASGECCDVGEYCCSGVCQAGECETGCPCSYRGAGYSLAYVEYDTGYEICCPPGTTWNSVDELCDCEDDDPQCTPGTPWYVSPSGPDDFVNCGGYCVKIPEECPP